MSRSRLSALLVAGGLCLLTAPAAAERLVLEWVMEDGRLLVGVRQVAHWLGAQVEWSEATRSVALRDTRVLVVLQVDLPRAWVNEAERTLEVPPRLIGGRVYVPLRFLTEALGAQVAYHGDHIAIIGADGQTRRGYLQTTARTGIGFP